MRRARAQRGSVLLLVVLALAIVAALSYAMSREAGTNVHEVTASSEAARANAVLEAGFAHARWRLAGSDTCTGYADIPTTPLGTDGYTVTLTPHSGSPVAAAATATLAGGLVRNATRSLPVFGEAIYYAQRSDPSKERDTWITSQSPLNTNGDSPLLHVADSLGVRHALLEFDLSSLRGETLHVLDARLELALPNTVPTVPIAVHRVTSHWRHDLASWLERDGGVPWLVPGGDFVAQPTDVIPVDLVGTYVWDVTPLVQGWLAGVIPNEGLLLRAAAPTGVVKFGSGDNLDVSKRPRLAIDFRCECGRTCGAMPNCEAVTPDARARDFQTDVHGPDGHTSGLAWLPEGTVMNGVIAPSGGAWVGVDYASTKFLMLDSDGVLLDHGLVAPDSLTGAAYVLSGSEADKLATVREIRDDEITYVDLDTGVETVVALSNGPDPLHIQKPSGLSFIANSDSGLYQEHLAILGNEDQRIFIVTQEGALQHTIDVSLLAGLPAGVAHVPGTDSFWVVDPDRDVAGVVDFAGNFERAWRPSQLGLLNPRSAAIYPGTCELVIGNDGGGAGPGVDEVAYLERLGAPAPPEKILTPVLEADTYIQDNEAVNHGDEITIDVGFLAGDTMHGLVRPDLSPIPAGSLIHHAALRLHHKLKDGDDVVATLPVQGGTDQTYVVVVTTKNNEDVPGVSGGGLVWTERVEQCDAANDTGVRIFTAQGSPTAPFRVQVGPKNMEDRYAVLMRYSGVASIVDPTGENSNGEAGPCSGGVTDDRARLTLTSSIGGAVHVVGVGPTDKEVVSTTPGYTLLGSLPGANPRTWVYQKPFAVPTTETFEAWLSGNTKKWATGGLVLHPAAGGIVLEEAVEGWELAGETVWVGAHRMQQTWTELGAEWTVADGITPWSGGPGGTYAASATDTIPITGGDVGWYEWEVTLVVQEWVDGIAPNHGFALVPASAIGTELEFESREEVKAWLRPGLLVRFTPP